jgi:hypothetical protein
MRQTSTSGCEKCDSPPFQCARSRFKVEFSDLGIGNQANVGCDIQQYQNHHDADQSSKSGTKKGGCGFFERVDIEAYT